MFKFDINVLAEIVATTGAAIDSFLTFFVKFEHHEKTVVDIGVLRYPDSEKYVFAPPPSTVNASHLSFQPIFQGVSYPAHGME